MSEGIGRVNQSRPFITHHSSLITSAMHTTLFYIPDVIPGTGIPVFGVGVLFAAWLVAALVSTLR